MGSNHYKIRVRFDNYDNYYILSLLIFLENDIVNDFRLVRSPGPQRQYLVLRYS